MQKSELHLKEISIEITFATFVIILFGEVFDSFLKEFLCCWLEENTIASEDVYSSENVILKFLNTFQEAIKSAMEKSWGQIMFSVPRTSKQQ